MASAAPLRIWRPSRLTPLMRVWARERHERRAELRGCRARAGRTSPWPARRCCAPRASRRPARPAARRRPARSRVDARRRAGTPSAWRLPSVIVPVLSSSSTSTSPAASTARPDMAITLAWIMRSMPAMPMADSSPPMVVGIRQTSSATSTVTVTGVPWPGGLHAVERERQQRRADEQEDDGQRRQQDVQRDLVGRLLALGAFDHGDHAVEEASRRGWR